MAAKKVKITYQDERPEEIVKVLPRAQVMTEQHFNGMNSENMHAIGFHLGWAALNSLKKTTLDFETWLDQIEDVEVIDEEPDPTPEVPSGDTSSDSPS